MPRITIIPLPSPCAPCHGVQKMPYRSCPRCNSSAVTGSGNEFDSLGTIIASSSSALRDTVPSINGRSERPSANDSEGSSGRYFGCNAMSCFRLQPASHSAHNAPHIAANTREICPLPMPLVIAHLTDMVRTDGLQKTSRACEIKLFVACLDAQVKAIRGRVFSEAFDVEQWMIRLWQSVQCQHPKHSE